LVAAVLAAVLAVAGADFLAVVAVAVLLPTARSAVLAVLAL
jgi:hypothetical protein